MMIALACAFVGCGRMTPQPNVVFILVDALRADHLHCYGYDRQTSPNVDALAREGLLFENVRSQASSTYPSLNSILTSRYPYEFFGQPDQRLGIPDGIASLPVLLKGAGYNTAAVSASPIVRKSKSRFNPTGGFAAGYDVFVESCAWRDAQEVNRRVLSSLSQLRNPFFLYIHYMEPHGPYRPPDGFRRFSGAYSNKEFIARGDPNPLEAEKGGMSTGVASADIEHLRDLYDDEIAYFDLKLGELINALKDRNLWGNTIVVLTADHGEEFMEHGYVKHAHTLFDTSLHVPLIMRIPGMPTSRAGGVVQSLDIAPTLLDYAGVDIRNIALSGRSLRPLIEEGKAVNEYAFAVQGSWRSVADGEFKLIKSHGGKRKMLYRVTSDTDERDDISAVETGVLARLDAALANWQSAFESGTGKSRRLPEEAQERLRSLGYIR